MSTAAASSSGNRNSATTAPWATPPPSMPRVEGPAGEHLCGVVRAAASEHPDHGHVGEREDRAEQRGDRPSSTCSPRDRARPSGAGSSRSVSRSSRAATATRSMTAPPESSRAAGPGSGPPICLGSPRRGCLCVTTSPRSGIPPSVLGAPTTTWTWCSHRPTVRGELDRGRVHHVAVLPLNRTDHRPTPSRKPLRRLHPLARRTSRTRDRVRHRLTERDLDALPDRGCLTSH